MLQQEQMAKSALQEEITFSPDACAGVSTIAVSNRWVPLSRRSSTLPAVEAALATAATRAPGVAGTLIDVTSLDAGDFTLTDGAAFARAALLRTSTAKERVLIGLVGPTYGEGVWERGTTESPFLCVGCMAEGVCMIH